MTALIILGAGGLGLEAKWVVESRGNRSFRGESLEIVAFVVEGPGGSETLDGISVDHDLQGALKRYDPSATKFHCAIGDNGARERVAELFLRRGFVAATLAHSSAVVAPSAEIGDGCYLGAFVVVGPMANVGEHVIMNTHAAIGHHALLEPYSQICPGGKVSGACKVGRRALVGSNATMLPRTRLAQDSVVGANSLMLRSTKPGESVIGVPAIPALRARPAKELGE